MFFLDKMIQILLNSVLKLSMQVKHLPNIISFLRLVLVFPFLHFSLNHQPKIAFLIFMFAAISDALDGWIARSFNCQSHLGLILDPLADKVLILSSYLILGAAHILPLWLVTLVFVRDITILSGAFVSLYILRRPHPLHPSFISKLNTVLQMLQIFLCLLQTAFGHISPLLLDSILISVCLTTTTSFLHYLYIWHQEITRKAL